MNNPHSRTHRLALAALFAAGAILPLSAVTFDGACRLSINDTDKTLTWDNGLKAMTVSCWVKFSVPSNVTLSENMFIAGDRNNGTWTSNQLVETHSYAMYFSVATGNIEFSSRGPGGYFTKTLVEKPFLERWYHLAVARNDTGIVGYVDGRRVFSDAINVGNSQSSDGMTIGGLGSGMFLRGEVLECEVFHAQLTQQTIAAYRFQDLNPANQAKLKGYYKLSASSDPADQLRNFAASPGAGTSPAVKTGTGALAFEQTSRDGEQSLFDSMKNGGKDAILPLSGGFDWEHTIFSRPTPGIPFELEINYSSGNAFNKAPLEDFDPFTPSSLGLGWRHNFEIRILPNSAFNPGSSTMSLGLMIADGNIETWDFLSASGDTTRFKTRHKEYRGELEFIGSSFDPEATVRWISPERLIYIFQSPFATNDDAATLGRLKEIRDLNGNRLFVDVHKVGDKAGLVNNVTDSSGGVWTFNYDGQNRLATVTGLGWTANFTYDASNRLSGQALSGPSTYEAPSSTAWSFQYTTSEPAGLVYRVNNPRGAREIEVAYDKYGRKTTEYDGVGRITTYKYNVPALRQLTTTRQNGGSTDPANDRKTVQTFDRKLRVLSIQDALGYVNSLQYDDAGNVVLATDARLNRTSMTYDSRSNMLSRTNPLGQAERWEYNHVLAGGIACNEPTKEIRPATEEAPGGWENRFTYDTAGNLLTHTDDLGTLAEHQYDARGLVFSSKDANGSETRYGYDVNGFRNSVTAAHGTAMAATTSSTMSELGWPLSTTTPLGETTSLYYDHNGRVVRTIDPIDRVITRKYDNNGNLLEESDGNGALTKHQYNDNNEHTRTTDRLNNVWDFTYNSFGEPYQTYGPAVLSDGTTQRDTITKTYDANGRLIKLADPYGDYVAYEYDANDNQVASIDKLGKRWEKTYDALDRLVAEKDPEGNVRATHYDAAGRIKVVLSPNGYPSTHDYDGRSRLKTWTDPEGYRWIYSYDGVGNILDIEDALGGHYVMTYGPRNERLTERNQDSKSWAYTYDPMVRMLTHTDPNGITRTIFYDAVGRLQSVEFSTGRINSLGYDNNNNVVAMTRTKPGSSTTTLNLVYDAMDRMTETRDTFSKTVRYAYDAVGRVKTKTYPGGKSLTQTYDRLGRLKGLGFAYSTSQNFTCSFEYDKADRLTARTYPNGIRQTNVFDQAGRLTSLEYKTSGNSSLIALGYAYDRNGNKVAGSEQGTLDWQAAASADYDETSRFTAAGRLIDRTDAAPGVPKVMQYTYDNSGNMIRAATSGESYDLGYDEDNRTTLIEWENGLSSKTIINRYDALGRRISRKADGVETRYVLDVLGDMERIMCDTDANGITSAWYVHGPDLCFKVNSTGQLTCYHSDAMGNVLRTSDSAGATVNQYAYTPYGRSLDTAGSAPDPDPYRFVGSQGVMLELPGLYFMRARYYSADAAVFLATDPVKNIGPGWRSNLYEYVNSNPLLSVDPTGLYTISLGLEGSLGASFFAGVEISGYRGIVIETQAISHGDWGEAIGLTQEVSAEAKAGMEIGLSSGLQVKAKGESTGYGVSSSNGVSMGMSANAQAGITSASITNSGSWSFGIGAKPVVGISSSAFVSYQRTVSLKSIVSNAINLFSNKATNANTNSSATKNISKKIANNTPSANTHASNLNSQQSTKPSSPTVKSSGTGGVSRAITTTKSTISSITKSVKTTVSNAVNSAKSAVTKFVSKIKSIFKKKK